MSGVADIRLKLLSGISITFFLFAGCTSMTNTIATNFTTFAPDRIVSVDGVAVNYSASLQPAKEPTLVLIHGFGASMQTWTDIYPLLCNHHSVVRMDLKGVGFSSKPRDHQYAPADQARLVLGFLRALNLTNVVLIGHSLGGGIALLTYFQSADSHGINVNGLVLIDSAGYPQKLPFFISAVRNPITRCLSHFTSPCYRAKFVLERICKVNTQITPERVSRYAFCLDTPGSRYALYQTAKHIVPANVSAVSAQFPAIQIPVLIVWGEDDPVIALEKGRRFNQDIPKSRLVVLNDTGHITQEERPAETYEAIDEFVKSIR